MSLVRHQRTSSRGDSVAAGSLRSESVRNKRTRRQTSPGAFPSHSVFNIRDQTLSILFPRHTQLNMPCGQNIDSLVPVRHYKPFQHDRTFFWVYFPFSRGLSCVLFRRTPRACCENPTPSFPSVLRRIIGPRHAIAFRRLEFFGNLPTEPVTRTSDKSPVPPTWPGYAGVCRPSKLEIQGIQDPLKKPGP